MATKPAKRHGSKSAFIREHSSLTAPQLVALAKKNGMKISEAYVHTARSIHRKAAGEGTSAPRARSSSSNGAPDKRRTFAKIAVEIGLDTARAVLEQLESRV